MKLSTSKRKQSSQKDSSRRSSTQKKTMDNVPRVQIFLDAHLKKAFNTLKMQKSAKTELNEQGSLQSSRKFRVQFSQIQQTINPTLIQNSIVMNYIRQVYEKYNIPDPLEDQFDFPMIDSYQTYRTQKKNRKVSINQKKIIDLKNKFKNEIEAFQETAKKIQTPTSLKYQKEGTNAFDFQNDTTLQQSKQDSPEKEYNQKQKKVVLLKINKKIETNQTQSFDRKFPYQNFRKRGCSKPYILEELPNTQTNSIRNTKIAQLFRYCFMCEQYILHANITYHQKECTKLQMAYQMSFQQLGQILQNKIQRLKSQIISGKLMKMQQQSINNIKNCITEWIQSINASKQLKQKQATNSRNYQVVSKTISQNMLQPYNIIHKLHWFIRLKQNIQRNY